MTGMSKEEEVSDRVKALSSLIEKRKEFRERIRHGVDWLTFTSEEETVRQQLMQLLSVPVLPEETNSVRMALQALLEINKDITTHVELCRREAFSSLQHATLVQRAASAYGRVAGA